MTKLTVEELVEETAGTLQNMMVANVSLLAAQAIAKEILSHLNLYTRIKCEDCNGEGRILIGADDVMDCEQCDSTGEVFIPLAEALKEVNDGNTE